MLWTGEVLDAEKAHSIGLVTHVVQYEELASFTKAYCSKRVKGPQEVIQMMKRVVNEGMDMSL